MNYKTPYLTTLILVLFMFSCRPNLSFEEAPTTYGEIDQKKIDSLSVFPLLRQSSLNNKINIVFDFEVTRGLVLIDQGQSIELEFSIERLESFDAELAYGFADAPEGTKIVKRNVDEFVIQNRSPEFNEFVPMKITVIVRDVELCKESLTEEDCSLEDPYGHYSVHENFDRLLRLNVNSK